MKKTMFLPVVAVGLLVVLVNLETIRTFPSWFDEAFMANVAFNLAQGKGPILDLIPKYYITEITLYGPVYFYLQALLIDSFGLQAFVFRLPNLLAAYVSVFLLAMVLRRNEVSRPCWLLFVIAAVVDVSFNRNLVSGRMDLLAVTFVVLALYLASRKPTAVRSWEIATWLLVGGSSVLAYLTTPRALFLLPVVVVVGLHQLYWASGGRSRTDSSMNVIVGAAAFLIPVSVWIQHVGGLQAYVSLFTASKQTAQHIAPSFFRSTYDNLGILIMLALSLLNIRRVLQSPLLIGLLLNYIAFSLFANELGPYAGMIMPFVLATIVVILDQLTWKPLPKYALLALVILPGVLLLGLRGVDLPLNAGCRDNTKVITVIENLARGSGQIVAPFKYYFFLEEPNRAVVTLEYSRIDRERVVEKADLVVQDKRASEWLTKLGFAKRAQLDCDPRPVPLLPETFYRRSVFDEAFYQR